MEMTATEKEKVAYMYIARQLRLAFILTMSLVFHYQRDGRLWCKEKSNHFWAHTVQYVVKGIDWLENFKMSKEIFDYLCNELSDYIGKKSTNMRRAIQAKDR